MPMLLDNNWIRINSWKIKHDFEIVRIAYQIVLSIILLQIFEIAHTQWRRQGQVGVRRPNNLWPALKFF